MRLEHIPTQSPDEADVVVGVVVETSRPSAGAELLAGQDEDALDDDHALRTHGDGRAAARVGGEEVVGWNADRSAFAQLADVAAMGSTSTASGWSKFWADLSAKDRCARSL